jgi:hypothetical protein
VNESLYDTSNAGEVMVVNFATSKNVIVKRKMFTHLSIRNSTQPSADGGIHNQIA